LAWQKYVDRNSLRTDISKDMLTDWKNRVPQEDGDYIATNLADYDDLMPGRKNRRRGAEKVGEVIARGYAGSFCKNQSVGISLPKPSRRVLVRMRAPVRVSLRI
jgi:hypothetical protein